MRLKNLNSIYGYYLLQSYFIQNEIQLKKDGMGVPHLFQKDINNFTILFPPIEEQSAISEYLDKNISIIDRKIRLLEQKIDHFTNLRKALINKAISQGIDHNAKLVKSKIDWIKSYPQHWDVRRGKDVFKESSKKNRPDLPLLASSQKLGVVLKTMLENRSMEAQKNFEIFKWVKIGDFVISLRSFEGGIETAYYEGIISPAYTVFNFREELVTDYFKYLFKSESFIRFLQSNITGIRDGQSIRFSEIERAFFPIPPVREQKIIAEFIDSNVPKVDKIINNLQQQVIVNKELRSALINDVVTGKKKVYN